MAEIPVAPQYKLGLALSGGSIKGFAHLGVLKYLDEVGLSPDIIAGTSAGSIMGAFYASGYAPDEIFEIFSNTGFMQMTRLTTSGGGLFSTTNFFRLLKNNLRYRRLEDLPLPMRIVATDLSAGEQHVFTEGRLADSLGSSWRQAVCLSSSAPWKSGEETMSTEGCFATSL